MLDRSANPDRRRPRAVALGALAGLVAGAAVSVAGIGGAVPPAAPAPVVAAADGPAQVAVISRLLDAFSTGAAAGPGVINGVVATVVGSQTFPPPGDQLQGAFLTAFTEVGAQIKTQGQAGVEAMREGLAPLACANPAVNQGIEAFAGGLDSIAATGAVIAPLDLTAAELATLFRSFKAPETSC